LRAAAVTGLGIGFELTVELFELFELFGGVGHDLPVLNGNALWVMPLPPTYAIDPDGRVVFPHRNGLSRAAEPNDVPAIITAELERR
jgi:hypothetical protein